MSQLIEAQKGTIYDFILTEEAGFSHPIDMDGWSWSMKNHIRRSVLYKNSELETGKNWGTVDQKPVKNIVLPLMNLRYRAEDIDMKDITLYVDDPAKQHLSFLIKKYHDDVFVLENNLDEFFDDVKEEKIDFGAGIAKDIGQAKPDVVHLQSIAFCDQTDLVNGTICIKHQYTPDKLKEMEKAGWGNPNNGATASVDDVIDFVENTRQQQKERVPNETPSYYVDIYEIHGVLDSEYLMEDTTDRYTRQMHIVAFVEDDKKKKQGITLFAKKEAKNPFKIAMGDKIFGRALGRGGIEELFDAQVWVNYGEIRVKEMLDAVSKIIIKTTDSTLAAKHPSGLKTMKNMEIIELADGTDAGVLDNQPRNLQLFENKVAEWWQHARELEAAQEGITGSQPASGTPFKLQELISAESHALHDYRRGKYAKWIEEVYRDWVIPYIGRKVRNGVRFLSELSADEMDFVASTIAENEANRRRNEAVLNGEIPPVKETMIEIIKEKFRKGDNKRFITILKDEFKDIGMKVKVNVSNKQKDLSLVTDKLVNIFRFIFSTYDPQTQQFVVFQNKGMVKLFNQIVEHSGFSPADFDFQTQASVPSQKQITEAATKPLQELAQRKESPIPSQV